MDVQGRLSVGIVGFGRIGAEHAAWLERADVIRATAAADFTAARRELAARRGLKTHETLGTMLADETIDVVLVSTPTAAHAQDAAAALAAGKHVMVEKPMALNLAEARELVDLAEKQRRVLSVFHNRRWDVDYLTVKQAIDAGMLGRIINIESRIGQWASCVGPAAKEWRPGWRNEASFGGGGLYDWGSHFIDQLWRMVLPAKPVRVFAQLRGNVWSSECDDFARVMIDFDNGAVGMVEINTTTTRPLPRWHIDGTTGSADSPHSATFDVNTWSALAFRPAAEAVGDAPLQLLPRASGALTETQIWEHFAQAVRGESESAVTARSVLPTMALLDAARESSRGGTAINLNAKSVVW
jgi:scyllo-inositol 2-dehydrogenase (NADP+)